MRRRNNPNGASTRVLGPPAARQRGEGGRNPVAEKTVEESCCREDSGGKPDPRTRRTLQHGRSRRSRRSRRASREHSLWRTYRYTRGHVEDEPKKPKVTKKPKKAKEAKETQNHTTQWPIVFVPEGQWRGRGGPPDRGRRGQRVLRGQRVSRGISRLRRQRRPFFFTRNGVFWDACWSWLGARPRTALWQTGGNGTHAVRSAVGRAVGRTAHTGGAGLWNRRQAHGVLAV